MVRWVPRSVIIEIFILRMLRAGRLRDSGTLFMSLSFGRKYLDRLCATVFSPSKLKSITTDDDDDELLEISFIRRTLC